MSFTLKDNSQQKQSRERFTVPKGTYAAILVRMYDLGTKETEYAGKKKDRRMVQFIFELPTVTHTYNEEKGPQPSWLHAKFTISMYYNEKTQMSSKLHDFIKNAIGETPSQSYDIGQLLGKKFMVVVDHREWQDKTYENIVSATLITKSNYELYNVDWKKIVPANEVFGISLDESGVWESEEFGKIGEWTQNLMKESKEYESYLKTKQAETKDSDIPLEEQGEELPNPNSFI